ncbi:hypothetical protein QCA50_000450 [Cerrena zonata]|uniref:Uncharacterized protein n=1 Tax=Cerrena zonata TaxID=2478898 RepID=A0AAW0GT27_9APHY
MDNSILQERIKREYKTANKTREGYIDESEEEEEEPKLSMAGKDMRKLMKKLEKNLAYDESDDDRNPYASSDDESSSEDEPPPVPQGPAIIPPDPKTTSRSGSQAPSLANGGKNLNGSQTPLTVKTDATSRPTSPVASPSHGGHSVVAKRATSPKAPKGNITGSRAGSPLAGSRATSPVGSRASSPVAQSPMAAKPNNKRKATDDPTSPTTGAPAKPKKRKPAPAGELDAQMLIEWVRVTPNPTTRDCIAHFQPYLRGSEDKKRFAMLVKENAVLKDNILHLRSDLRKDGGTSTPAAAPSPTAASSG